MAYYQRHPALSSNAMPPQLPSQTGGTRQPAQSQLYPPAATRKNPLPIIDPTTGKAILDGLNQDSVTPPKSSTLQEKETDMARHVLQRSKMTSDEVNYVWIISDFSVEHLLEVAIRSPSFRCFNTDFHLELSHQGMIRLRLIQSDSDDPPRITSCEIGFYFSSPSTAKYVKKLETPVKLADIARTISVVDMKRDCLAGGVLKVFCQLTTSKVKHTLEAPSGTMAKVNKKPFLKQGHSALSENFGNILEDSPFFDVTLKVGEETIPAHKAILAGRSTVFEGMFKSDMKESQLSVVEIAEMTPAIARKMLQYIYTGTVGDLSVDAAIDLYVGSDRYDLQELKGWCKEFILEHISSDDVCRVAAIADLHSDEELATAARRVFKKDPKSIVGSEAWRDYKKENPSLLFDLLGSVLISDD